MKNALLDMAQGASNAAASTVSAPVDAIAWLLRKAGVNIPAPVGGSDWMAAQGLTKQPKNALAGIAGESLGLVSPMMAAAKAPQIANALLKAGDNLANTQRIPMSAQRGMFVGHLSKTWDKAAADKAAAMEKAGADARAIWKETGTFKGVDGKWRQEIDDSAAFLMPENKSAVDWMSGPGPSNYPVGEVSNVISHGALNSAYPDVMAIKTNLVKGTSGSYLPKTGFGEGFDLPAIFDGGKYTKPDLTKSTALHELQHAIQTREGFSLGGSSSDNYKEYLRLAGEAEARAVQARMNLDKKQRQALFPLDSYDVPIKRLIGR